MTMEPSRSELFVAWNECHPAKTWARPFCCWPSRAWSLPGSRLAADRQPGQARRCRREGRARPSRPKGDAGASGATIRDWKIDRALRRDSRHERCQRGSAPRAAQVVRTVFARAGLGVIAHYAIGDVASVSWIETEVVNRSTANARTAAGP